MPWMFDYLCECGHKFDNLHMGSRDEVPEYLPCTGYISQHMKPASLGDSSTPLQPTLVKCSRLAQRTVSAVRSNTIVKGNSDFLPREKERLTKRSQDYDNSVKGKQAKLEATERRLKAGGIL